MPVPEPILVLGAGAPPDVLAIAVAMGVAAEKSVPAEAANAGVTQAQVDASKAACASNKTSLRFISFECSVRHFRAHYSLASLICV